LDLVQIPFELSQLESLKSLDLSGNLFRNVPGPVVALSSLELLNLANNRITNIVELRALERLKSLQLRNNKLDELPRELAELASLERLDVGLNQLTRLEAGMGDIATSSARHPHLRQRMCGRLVNYDATRGSKSFGAGDSREESGGSATHDCNFALAAHAGTVGASPTESTRNHPDKKRPPRAAIRGGTGTNLKPRA